MTVVPADTPFASSKTILDGGDDLETLKARLDKIHAGAVDHFFVTYLGCWKREDPRTAQETTVVAGTLVAAMIDVAARVAHDLMVTPDQLKAMAQESYDRAEAGAPRWG